MIRPRGGIGVLDAVAIGLITVGVLAIWAFQLFVVPTFHGMFADFGSGANLPAITLLVLRPLVACVATVVTLALMASGLAARFTTRPAIGTVVLVVAALLPLVTIPFMVAAMYAPIFELAGRVSP